MHSYELTVIMDPGIAEEDVPKTLEKVTALIVKNGGSVDEVDHWGRRKLAYPIAHRGDGNYVVMRLQLEPTETAELEASLNLSEDFLRHLLVRLDG